MRTRAVLLLMTCVLTGSAISYAAMSADEIARRAYAVDDGSDVKAVMTMKIVRADGAVKARELRLYRKDYGNDNRVLVVFMSPADVKDTAFLTWNYHDRESDQWLYLPALRKANRIAASGRDKSFMKSDFSYEDLSKRALSRDVYSLLREEKIDGQNCYVLEARPRDASESIARRVYWVRADSFVAVRVDSLDSSGQAVKRFTVQKLENISGIWTVLSCRMDDVKKRTHTILEMSQVQYNTGLADRLFRSDSLGN